MGTTELTAPGETQLPAVSTVREITNGKVRCEERTSYRCNQSIAPFDGVHWPARSDFIKVEFRDLSKNGFGYVCGIPPTTLQVVAELGQPPELLYFIADVMNCSLERKTEGLLFRVGCKFVKRVPY